MTIHHISESLKVIHDDLEAAKRRHPAMAGRDDDPHPVKDHHGEGWRRAYPGVIYFERKQAG
jgi:hypothetical protein